MAELTLRFPVHTLAKQDLIPAGTVLSDDLLRDLAGSHPRATDRELSFLKYGSIRRDIESYMRQAVYRHIFGETDEHGHILGLMEQVRFPRPVFDILRYFRENDPYTYRHILIVSALTCLFVRGLSADLRDSFPEISAGPLHDLGKVSVPLELLRRSKPLRRSERAYLEHHTLAGFALLGYHLRDAKKFSCIVARDHHERGDGSGYPRGIRLEDRMVEIVVACDVYDALISARPYRKSSFDNRTAIEELTTMAEEGKIGWEVVRFLVSRNRKGRPPMVECTVSQEKRGIPPEGNLYGIVLDDDDPQDVEGPAGR